MGSCWGTSPYAAYAAKMRKTSGVKFSYSNVENQNITVSTVGPVNMPFNTTSTIPTVSQAVMTAPSVQSPRGPMQMVQQPMVQPAAYPPATYAAPSGYASNYRPGSPMRM